MFQWTFLKFSFLIPALLATLVLTFQINKPFTGHHDFTSAFDGMIAKNYLKYGVWDLKFGQITGFPNDLETFKGYFTHYPPLLPLMIAGSFAIFGVHEWAERLVPVLFSVAGVSFFYLLIQRVWNFKIALLASMFFIFNPMFIYFGKMAVPDPLIVGVALSALYWFSLWIELRKPTYFLLCCASILIGGLISWSIFYIPCLFILYSLLTKRFEFKVMIPCLIFLLTLTIQLFHANILTGNFLGGGIFDALIGRTIGPGVSFGGVDFTYFNYLKQEITWLQAFYTRMLLILSAIYLIFNFNLKFNNSKALVLVLMLFGLGHIVIFSSYVFIHDFLNIYLLPFLALSGALGLNIVLTWLTRIKISKLVRLGFVMMILMIFALERLEFAKALLNTKMNEPGLVMAERINSLQQLKREVVILSPRFFDFYGVFTTFYSKLQYDISTDLALKQDPNLLDYKYVITFDEDINDLEFYNSLVKKHKSKKDKDLTVIYLNEKL